MPIEQLHVPIAADEDGVIRVAGTQVTLESVVASFDSGATAEADPANAVLPARLVARRTGRG